MSSPTASMTLFMLAIESGCCACSPSGLRLHLRRKGSSTWWSKGWGGMGRV